MNIFFPLSFILHPLFKTTAVLRESLSVTAEKGKPTRKCCCAFPLQSPPPLLLLSSYLLSSFLLSSLFLLRQALRIGCHMTKLTRLLACMHVLQTYKCGNQSKMHVLQQKDRQHMHYRGTKGGKEQKKETDRALVQARRRKGKYGTLASTLLGDRESE